MSQAAGSTQLPQPYRASAGCLEAPFTAKSVSTSAKAGGYACRVGRSQGSRYGRIRDMTEDSPHILVVDDDDRLRDLLSRFLGESGFRVTTARDAGDARAKIASIAFDLIVLDVMMPGESGFDLTASLALSAPGLPVLLLTAMGDPEDRIAGLELGAEDYLAKPFEPRELVLRMRAILRRRDSTPERAGVRTVRFGRFAFDMEREQLRLEGEPVRLTSAEAAMLRIFAARAGETLTRDELSDLAGMSGNVRAVDVQVTRLRRKIEPDPKFPRHLQTVWGRGYVLRPD